MASTRTRTITLRVSHDNLAAINRAAKRAGIDRNSYILDWVPEYRKAPPHARVVRTVARLDADGAVRIVDEVVDSP
jgi:uncharacterized protein (DUF1778 family)